MATNKVISFPARGNGPHLKGKTLLIPEMNRTGANLLAATFRGFGVRARVMDTYKGMDLGKEYTSGKECYPCQVTMGDILHFIEEEKDTLGDSFNPGDYIYFMPEAEGPCRFGKCKSSPPVTAMLTHWGISLKRARSKISEKRHIFPWW